MKELIVDNKKLLEFVLYKLEKEYSKTIGGNPGFSNNNIPNRNGLAKAIEVVSSIKEDYEILYELENI